MDTFDTILFESAAVRIGRFLCPARHPRFHDTGPTEGFLFVFPRTAVRIVHPGRPPIDADPTVVTLYNRGQRYRREKLSEEGDLCEFFSVDPAWILEAVRPYDPAALEAPDRPFRRTHGPSDARAYLFQRLLVTRLLDGAQAPDPLAVEESVVRLLRRVVDGVYGSQPVPRAKRPGTGRAHGELVDRARCVLRSKFQEPLDLASLAREVGTSPFHLCRVFHQRTGTTLHAYRDQLRLRAALHAVADTRHDLGWVGMDLGYATPSHFSHAFKTAFGLTPTAFRQRASAARLSELSNLLTA
ncbi:MAG TPA: AraC family transcriptional regulator [Candidatus Polarisedimenticolaceae bacterium]|nr:AraC family transcriptional regulator [Candidatus Polarisedimenticolaceae bacterium]